MRGGTAPPHRGGGSMGRATRHARYGLLGRVRAGARAGGRRAAPPPCAPALPQPSSPTHACRMARPMQPAATRLRFAPAPPPPIHRMRSVGGSAGAPPYGFAGARLLPVGRRCRNTIHRRRCNRHRRTATPVPVRPPRGLPVAFWLQAGRRRGGAQESQGTGGGAGARKIARGFATPGRPSRMAGTGQRPRQRKRAVTPVAFSACHARRAALRPCTPARALASRRAPPHHRPPFRQKALGLFFGLSWSVFHVQQ